MMKKNALGTNQKKFFAKVKNKKNNTNIGITCTKPL